MRSGAVPLSKVERGLVVARSSIAGRSLRVVADALSSPSPLVDGWLLHGCQSPAVAGELSCDRDGDDRASFAAPFKVPPALVESARALLGLRSHGPSLRRLVERVFWGRVGTRFC